MLQERKRCADKKHYQGPRPVPVAVKTTQREMLAEAINGKRVEQRQVLHGYKNLVSVRDSGGWRRGEGGGSGVERAPAGVLGEARKKFENVL